MAWLVLAGFALAAVLLSVLITFLMRKALPGCPTFFVALLAAIPAPLLIWLTGAGLGECAYPHPQETNAMKCPYVREAAVQVLMLITGLVGFLIAFIAPARNKS